MQKQPWVFHLHRLWPHHLASARGEYGSNSGRTPPTPFPEDSQNWPQNSITLCPFPIQSAPGVLIHTHPHPPRACPSPTQCFSLHTVLPLWLITRTKGRANNPAMFRELPGALLCTLDLAIHTGPPGSPTCLVSDPNACPILKFQAPPRDVPIPLLPFWAHAGWICDPNHLASATEASAGECQSQGRSVYQNTEHPGSQHILWPL